MNEDFIVEIEEAVEDLPEEVRHFAFGDDMDAVKGELGTIVKDPAECNDLVNEVLLFIFGVKAVDELKKKIESLLISPDEKEKVKNIIQDKVITELLLLLQVHQEMEDGEVSLSPSTQTGNTAAPNPSDVLASLKARLTTASSIAPVIKELPSGFTAAKPSEKRAIDPYREIPER